MNEQTVVAFERFLEYGPIGLAGLMLVLVVFALSMSELTEVRANLLKFLMVIGGLCFAASLAAQVFSHDGSHTMKISVVPGDLAEKPHISPPELTVDGAEVSVQESHSIEKDFLILIDLSTAVARAESALNDVSEESDAALENLRVESAAVLESLRKETGKSLTEMQLKITKIATELEKVRAVQEVLSTLQSEAPGVEVLRIARALNRQIDQFVVNVEPIVSTAKVEN